MSETQIPPQSPETNPKTESTSDLLEVGKKLLTLGFAGKAVLKHAATISLRHRTGYLVKALRHLRRQIESKIPWKNLPVDIRTFVESVDFLNQAGVIYDKNLDALEDMNSGDYVEAVLTGAIGTGKSTLALYSQAYQVYILSCIHRPQRLFRLAESSELLIVFQSITAELAKKVEYDRFKALLDSAPYFQHAFKYDKSITSEMRFPGRIIVRPLSGSQFAAIGQNVLGAILDEVNYMAVIESSKNSSDGGVFDQALELYNSIVRRRKSRFMIKGKLIGMLCLVSSKRYPGEFTDQKALEAQNQIREHGKTDIYVYDRRLWEVKPDDTYSEDRFELFLGDSARKPRILEDYEEVAEADEHLVMLIPTDFRSEFERDLLSAIRDVAGMATLALHPYIVDAEAVAKAFGKSVSVVSRDECDFVKTTLQILPSRIVNPGEPRFAHVDLSLTKDSTGVAVGHIKGFKEVQRGGWSETLPIVRYDLLLEVSPPKAGEIEFAKIRTLLYRLRELGMNLKWITFDSYQSKDSQQILAQQGFMTGMQSMDTDMLGYDMLKSGFYDERVEAPACAKAQREIVRLERNPKTGKVDHPANSSKDLSDAMAGVFLGLTMRRELWHRHGVAANKIPASLVKRQANPPKGLIEKLDEID